ncbi:MAG: Sigma-54 dependent DNA-binding response regulator [Polyangiaceae bacterium]|nr:Sigma-54 dependent DNA-binding response regulator [Polyangiaceae bacterium]
MLDARVSGLALEWVWPTSRIDSLQGGKLSIGRDHEAAIRIEGSGVSRHHAELYRQGPLYVIRDLGSTNGTWVAGRRIEHAPVHPGSVIRIGEWVAVVVSRMEGPPAVEFSELAPGLFGGAAIAELLSPLKRAATSALPVLLIGATGTGKERLACAVHHLSGRKGPFLALNCAALPEQLAESELFGHRRGAFTGAERNSPGYFRAANGGTLFLDEMPELAATLQAKLLRVVEDRQVMGLGEVSSTPVDVRIVSASQKPLHELVAGGRLRADLAARLGGLELLIPPLASRRSDIAGLFSQFLKQQTGGRPPAVEARVVEALCLHHWAGNVRELELLTRRLLAVHGHEPKLRRQHLPPELRAVTENLSARSPQSSSQMGRRDHELARLRHELAQNGGNVKAAAAAMGVSRQRVYRLLEGDADLAPARGSENESGN